MGPVAEPQSPGSLGRPGQQRQAETGEYALALYSVHQYLEDNSFAEDRDLQEALGDLFLQELYGGSSLALTVAQGYGFMDEQALWLTGESSWSLMMGRPDQRALDLCPGGCQPPQQRSVAGLPGSESDPGG
jgi:hypothetical protein